MKKNYRLGICLWASYGLLACTQEVKVYTTSETSGGGSTIGGWDSAGHCGFR